MHTESFTSFNWETVFTTYPYNLIALACLGISVFFACISIMIAISSKRRISRLLHGKNAQDIDEVLIHVYKNISALDQFKQKTIVDLNIMNGKIARSTQSIETIRFNPFKGTGTGGNQSFATALINEHGEGVILSSLYSSDRVSIFAKPVANFTPTFEVTEEEKAVLEQAMAKLK
jgi:hypothetical protein